jgi:hypothetical protein
METVQQHGTKTFLKPVPAHLNLRIDGSTAFGRN